MPASDMPDFSNDLLAQFAARHAARVDTPIIQPAEPFLDIAGEDLRRRIFLTQSETGENLCLRPEFTIPVCMRHIERAMGTPRRYSYLGQVFRQRRDGPSEFYQAGIEDLGDQDVAGADARAVADALGILTKLLPQNRFTVTIGDQAVFEAVVQALGLPVGWQKRLIHAFGNMLHLENLLASLVNPRSGTSLSDEIVKLSEDEAALSAYIAQRMEETGYSTNASRSPVEIARRLREKRTLSETRLDEGAFRILERFLSLDVSLNDASKALSDFAGQAGLNVGDALKLFDARIATLASSGIDLSMIEYRAAFGRPLDYYTGLVFEIVAQGEGDVLVGGGRYDRLLTLLGAQDHIPAVGFSLWLDRIEKVGGDQ
ncbi:ATP phosphoribosyltransferase regulatory subunit [Oryzifoliimicrobium ureilyticus]|uniref:ATP phosphoribosyltransferase regulatory subunit n=1 Tax=Oryzifoliimicrobium ureilyticus TaxID=3113724 RepID=UPI0030767686